MSDERIAGFWLHCAPVLSLLAVSAAWYVGNPISTGALMIVNAGVILVHGSYVTSLERLAVNLLKGTASVTPTTPTTPN